MAEDAVRHLLVVVCDFSPMWWGKQTSTSETGAFCVAYAEDLQRGVPKFALYFITKVSVELPVFGMNLTQNASSQFIYPMSEASKNSENGGENQADGKYEHFAVMNNIVVSKLKGIIEEESISCSDIILSENTSALLAGALSMALCYIKQAERNCPVGQSLKARILVLKGSHDVSTQYMATMNCIFAAQKNNIAIDSCLLKSDSGFLQQASDITGGIYFKVLKMESLLQYLLWVFLPEPSTRESLVLPAAVQIDYRAACFCHRTLVDIGFVCSVCLSIYCQLLPRCRTCQTRFKLPMASIARPKKKKKEKSSD